ncbi:ACP phosphodiesterase [uncultured Psychromonas sp.]|uniref:acyl carrier protein phosphodiesterase n=1 Tax=uncultured Psychromonas sp. TaxID=173974 RepID=UPI00261F5EE3|nr:ACP phosphodiesterase [uncultured Psychromonas sp.]
MNYLAHLHIAEVTNTSFSGNFLGDFVKGNPEGLFPKEIVEGIRLHRYVDSFTDKHTQVLAAKLLFPQSLRRYAPIALDMFWDHFLARHWSSFHASSLAEFCQLAEQNIIKETNNKDVLLPERFLRVNHWVWQDKWLESYQKTSNIEYALQRMATRSERMAPLAETGKILNEHYNQLSDIFFELYGHVLQASDEFVVDYRN